MGDTPGHTFRGNQHTSGGGRAPIEHPHDRAKRIAESSAAHTSVEDRSAQGLAKIAANGRAAAGRDNPSKNTKSEDRRTAALAEMQRQHDMKPSRDLENFFSKMYHKR